MTCRYGSLEARGSSRAGTHTRVCSCCVHVQDLVDKYNNVLESLHPLRERGTRSESPEVVDKEDAVLEHRLAGMEKVGWALATNSFREAPAAGDEALRVAAGSSGLAIVGKALRPSGGVQSGAGGVGEEKEGEEQEGDEEGGEAEAEAAAEAAVETTVELSTVEKQQYQQWLDIALPLSYGESWSSATVT